MLQLMKTEKNRLKMSKTKKLLLSKILDYGSMFI